MSNTPMGVNPQVLGAITSVAQVAKQASQTAQTAQQMAANNAKQIASLSSSGSAIGVPTQIRNGSVIINSGAAVSWTTKPSGAPSGASWVLLTGYAYFSTPDNANVELDFRSDGSGATICACRYRSVPVSYTHLTLPTKRIV